MIKYYGQTEKQTNKFLQHTQVRVTNKIVPYTYN